MNAKLRCKKDDLAIVLKGRYSGAIVTVLEFYGSRPIVTTQGKIQETVDAWYVTPPAAAKDRSRVKKYGMVVRDSSLLPIRAGDLKETEETGKELTG